MNAVVDTPMQEWLTTLDKTFSFSRCSVMFGPRLNTEDVIVSWQMISEGNHQYRFPEGWQVLKTNRQFRGMDLYHVQDDQGNRRAKFIVEKQDDQSFRGILTILHRFVIVHPEGQLPYILDRMRHSPLTKFPTQGTADFLIKWLRHNFPDYDNPLSYWSKLS